KHLPKPFTGDELERVMALELSQVEQALRGVLFYSGLRVSPICGLRLCDLSFSPTTFKSGLSVPRTIRPVTKANKVSVKPMHPALYAILRDFAPLLSVIRGCRCSPRKTASPGRARWWRSGCARGEGQPALWTAMRTDSDTRSPRTYSRAELTCA